MTRAYFVAAAVLLSSCAHPQRSMRELASQGYVDVVITGRARGACAENEDSATGFLAVKDGHRVEGAVCHEPFGDDVVRFRRADR